MSALELSKLEAREVPATLAVFNTSVLTVTGDGAANAITAAAPRRPRSGP